MKRLLPLLLIALFSVSVGFSQDTTTGLVGQFTFSGDAQDETGLLGSSSVQGPALTTDRTGASDAAYIFDGVDDYIEIPDDDLLDFDTGVDFSISLWFRTDPHTDNQIFVSKGSGNSVFTCRMLSDGRLQLFVRLNSPTNLIVETPASYDDGSWHHAAFVMRRSDTQKIYVDGLEVASAPVAMDAPLVNTTALRFGTFANAIQQVMKGELDDVSIYRRALSPADVEELAEVEIDLDAGLVGKFTFSGNAIDETGLLGSSTVQGATLTSDRNGTPSTAYSFDGSDDYIEIPDNDLLDFGTSGDFSFSLWFRSEPSDNNKIFIHKGTSTSGITTRMLSNGTLSFFLRLGSQNYVVETTDSYDDGKWHHASFVLDKNKSQEIYVDGTLAANSSFSRTETLTNTSAMRFGTFANGIDQVMLGDLDDIYIHNRVLLASEIKTLARLKFDPTEGLVGRFDFSGNTLDATGNLGSATVVGAQLAQDRNNVANAAYTFDGIDDYLEVADNELLDFGVEGDFSFALWFKASPHNGNRIFVNKGTSTSGITLRMLENGSISFFIRLGAQNEVLTTPGSYDDGLWHQVVFSADRSQKNTQVIYIDGAQVASRNFTTSGTLTNDTPLRFGTFAGGVSQVMKGELDDIYIYDRTLQQQEAEALAGTSINNAPQTTNSTIDLSIPEDAPETTLIADLIALFVDPENDNLFFDAVSSEQEVTVDVENNQVTVIPASDFFGSTVITITATDAFGASNSISGTVTVNPINDLPDFELSRTELTLGQDFQGTETVTITDLSPENEVETITYSLSPATISFANVSIDESTGEISISAVTGETGSQILDVVADDGQASVTKTLSLEVLANQAPEIISTVMNQTYEEDAGSVVLVADYTALFNDPDQDNLTYSFDSDNSDVTVAANGNELTALATANYFGTANVTITASDGAASTDLIFEVEITAVNDAPMVVNEVMDQTATEDLPFSFQLPGDTFEDVDNTDLSTSVAGRPDWLNFDEISGLFTGTPANEDVGTATLSVTVTDGEFSATDEFIITVENVNDAPSIVAVIPDQSFQEDEPSTSIDLNTVFEDVDGDQLTFSVIENLNAAISTDESNGILTLTPLADANGIGSLEISATDGVLTTTTSFDVNVAPVNDAPTFTLSESDLQLETNFSPATISIFEESVPADEINQEVSYRIETDIDFATFSIVGGVITVSAVPEASGTGTVTVVADDGEEENSTAEANFSLTVETALSVSDLFSSREVAFYPNPFVDHLMIESDELVSISIHDLDGKILKQQSLEKGRVDLTNTNPGVYLLVVEKKGQVATSKIIKVN